MFSLKRNAVLFLLWVAFASNVHAQAWVNDLLVHRMPSYTEGGQEDCLVCHSGANMRAMSENVHGNAEIAGTPASKQGCESCHGPGSIHVSRAHGGKGYPPLTVFGYGPASAPRDEQVGLCMDCHGAGGEAASAVEWDGVLHDRWIVNCATCHQSHAEADPVLNRRQQAEICFSCHMKQKEGHKKVGKRVPDFSKMGCAGCHRVHRAPKPEKSGE